MPDFLPAAVNDCAIAFDIAEKKFLFISPDINSVLGYAAADFYQNANLLYDIIYEDDRERIKSLTEKLLDGECIKLNYRIKTLSGELKSVDDKKSLIADQHTGRKVLLSMIGESTAEKNDNPAVGSSLGEDGFLFDNNPNPMMIYETANLRILKVNKAAIVRYGYSEQEFLTMYTRDLHPPGDPENFYTHLNKKKTGKAGFHGIFRSALWRHQNKKGEIIYADVTSQDIKFENRDCRIIIAADGTEKMRYQEEAIWTKNNLEALINNTEDQIWSVDKETRYVYMNKAYRNLIAGITGIEPKEGDYSYEHKGYPTEEIEKWNQYYRRALAGERYSIISESADLLTQQVLSFEISFNPIYKIKGDITGVGCFSRNITERLVTEKAMVDQNERLRHIASVTSHELRRPVASMLGLINIMDRSNFFNPDNKEVIEHLLTVGNEIDEVIRLIIDKTFMDGLTNNYRTP